jgi:molybdenum cofactor biosynthesis protein B
MSDQATPCGVNSPSVEAHRKAAVGVVRVAVITISDTRTLETDTSGTLLVDAFAGAGYEVIERLIVPDEVSDIRGAVTRLVGTVDAIITTGGTGIAPRDRTPEAIESLIEVPLPGFGELFRMLSYHEIGAASMLSRAFAGRIGTTLVFCLPGSNNAIRLAVDKLLLCELKHLVHHSRG